MTQLIIVLLYFAAMILMGVASRRRIWKLDDFLVAGRRCSSLWVTGSLVATIVGGSATVGMAGLGFTQGLTGVWWLLVGSIGLVVGGFFLAERVRSFALYTLPELIEKQYDGRVALAASILIATAWIGVIAGQITAAGLILSALEIGNPVLWMVLFTGVFVGYTVLGGQYAVIRTDLMQAIIIYVGIFAGLAFLLPRLGGLAGLASALPPERFAFPLSAKFGVKELISFLLLVGFTYVVGPDIYSRLFCAQDTKVARVSVLWTAVLLIPLALAITLTGMAASVVFAQISPEQAFPTVVKAVLSPFWGGIVLAALLSAVMSSADTTVLTASTILTVDVIARLKPSLSERQIMSLCRWGVVAVGLVSLALALVLKGVISALLFAYTIYTCGLALPVIAGFYKRQLRVTPRAALIAIVGGGLAALVSKVFGIRYLDLGGLLLSGLLLFAVSFLDNQRGGKSLDGKGGI